MNFKRRAGLGGILQRHELQARFRVVKHRMALAEGAPLHVLACQADGRSVRKDRRQRQFLRRCPVDGPLGGVVQSRTPTRSSTFELLVKGEAAGAVSRLSLISSGAATERRSRSCRRHPPLASEIGGTKSCSGFSDSSVCSSRVKCFFTSAWTDSADCLPCLISVSANSSRTVDAPRWPVHQRLRERRFIPFVVAEPAVTDQVDQKVATKPRAVFPRQTRRLETGHRVVGVDMDDRDLEPGAQGRSRSWCSDDSPGVAVKPIWLLAMT